MHDLSEGAAETAVRWWLEERVPLLRASTNDGEPERLEIITGWGKSRAVTARGDVRARVRSVLQELGCSLLPCRNPGCFWVDATTRSKQR